MSKINTTLLASGFCLNLVLLYLAVITIPVSWDEGWNFCVARNWVEKGFYGCEYMGQPTGPRLSTGPVSVSLVALGFKIFGVSILSGRLFFAIVTIGLLIIMCALTRRAFDLKAMVFVPWVFALISGDQRINPLFLGGQAWGEIPALFLLLTGCVWLNLADLNSRSFVVSLCVVPVVLSLCTFTKIHFYPFLIGTLSIAGLLFSMQKQFRVTLLILLSLGAVYFSSNWWYVFHLPFPPVIEGDGSGHAKLASALAVNTSSSVRLAALKIFAREGLLICALATLGIIISRHHILEWVRRCPGTYLGISVGVLWVGWFILLSVNFPRYLASGLILLVPIVSLVASRAFFKPLELGKSITVSPRVRRWGMSLVALIFIALALNSILVIRAFVSDFWESNQKLIETANYINSNTPRESIIESYETPLFFLVDRKISFPPDEVSFRALDGSLERIESFSPLRNNPNFLIVGLWSLHVFPVYEEILEREDHILLAVFGDFKVYQLPH